MVRACFGHSPPAASAIANNGRQLSATRIDQLSHVRVGETKGSAVIRSPSGSFARQVMQVDCAITAEGLYSFSWFATPELNCDHLSSSVDGRLPFMAMAAGAQVENWRGS